MRSDAPYVAAVYRSPFLAIAVMNFGQVLEVLCSRAPSIEDRLRKVLSAADAYGAKSIVVEPGSPLDELLPHKFNITRVSLRATMDQLIPEGTPRRHAALFRHLLERYPSLRRFMSMSADGSRILMLDRWKNIRMLPIALGIAAGFGARAKPVRPRSSHSTSIHSHQSVCVSSSPEPEGLAPSGSSARSKTAGGTRPESSSDVSGATSASPSSTSSDADTTSGAVPTPPSPTSMSTG